MNSLDGRIVYINFMNNLSVDCDCVSHPAVPELDDIGILASLDAVALDKACVDLVYASDPQKNASLRQRIESRNGIHTIEHAESLGLGSQQYQFIELDPLVGVVHDNQDIPSKFILNPVYPNPFNSGTTISYYLSSASFVELSIFNLKGQLVNCICKEKQNSGIHSYTWNPNSASTSMYFIQLTADNHTDIRRCIYLK